MDDVSGNFVVSSVLFVVVEAAATGVNKHITKMLFKELSNRRNANNIKVKCFI